MADRPADNSADAKHPLIIGQRRAFGPLSPAGKEVWHGNATPCVTCCQLIPRTGGTCEYCGQQHDAELLEKMARHSGPWFVFDHVRPFPGVSLERIIRLIERGSLTRTSIVRGPTTYYQWRFAGETPMVARLLGYCWNCQARAQRTASACSDCGVALDGRGVEQDARPEPERPNAVDEELVALSELAAAGSFRHASAAGPLHSARGRATAVFFVITVIVVLIVIAIAKLGHSKKETRSACHTPASSAPASTSDTAARLGHS